MGLYFVCSAAGAWAATNNSAWFSRAWQSDEGLPGNGVRGVAQTPDGFLWVATDDSLARFDGVNFTECRAAEADVAPGVRTLRMLADHLGRLWLGQVSMNGGGSLVCVEAGRTRVFTSQDGLPDAAVTGLAEDGEGTVWFVSRSSVSCIRDGEVRVIPTQEGPPGRGRFNLTADGRGQLWFARDDGIGVYRDGRFRMLLTLQGPVSALTGARGGGVWFGRGTHVLKYTGEGEPQDFGELAATRPAAQPTLLFEDRTGGLWAGTANEGLFRFDDPGFTRIDLPLHQITSVTDDREGNIWVGTDSGLHRLNTCAFELLELAGAASDDRTVSVCQDTAGTLWAAMKSGLLACREGKRWKILSAADGWAVRDATCVTPAPEGGVWVGTRSHGLYLWRNGVGGHFTKGNGLAGVNVTALLTTSSGDIWPATISGAAVQKMRDGRFQTFTLDKKYGPFGTLAEDAAGVVWVATSGGLLSRVSGDKLVDETANTLGTHHTISALCATPDGSLWIGYQGRGMGRLKMGRFTCFDKEQGLVDNFICQIVPDGRGRLWLAANRGLFAVEEKEFEAVAEGRLSRVHPVYYGRDEGLPTLQLNRGNGPSSWRSTDGRLWLPQRSGWVVVDPDRLKANREPPPVVIERVTVDDRTAAVWKFGENPRPAKSSPPLDLCQAAAHLVLAPGPRQIAFDYTGLSFASPRNVAFKYRLHGVDRKWVEAGARRVAYYSRLPPGDYRFQVIACNNDGVWNEAGASLTLTVLPHFWQTTWFFLTSLAGFAACVGGMTWLLGWLRNRRRIERMERLHALERERSRIARDMHDELGSNLTRIAWLSELAGTDKDLPDQVEVHSHKIGGYAQQMIRSLDEIVWAVNPRNDTLQSLAQYLTHIAYEYFSPTSINCRLDIPTDLPAVALSSEVRHALLMIAKEALHNILKHAAASEARVGLSVADGVLTFSVADNGRGFDPAHLAPGRQGNGLENLRQRILHLGGEFRCDSAPGQGTKWTFLLKLPNQG